MIPIIDAHLHIWRQQDLPWLVGPDGAAHLRPLRADPPRLSDRGISGRHRRTRAWRSPSMSRPTGRRSGSRTRSPGCRRRPTRRGWPHAIVGYADMMARRRPPGARPAEEAIRSCAACACSSTGTKTRLYRFAARPDLADDPLFRRNFSALADYDFSFDLQVFWPQMESAARLAADFPQTTFILQHAGMLEDLSPAGRDSWREGMRKLAARPNVVAKLSGLGTFIHRNDFDHIDLVINETVDLFGAERCLFGSNFPDREAVDALRKAHQGLSRRHRALPGGGAARHAP